MWNLSQNESEIPPQPLRPAPAPTSQAAGTSSSNHTKIVTFSVNLENEGPFVSHKESSDMFRPSILQTSLKQSMDIPVLEAPPQTKLANQFVASIPATAIPRPVVKKSPQQNGFCMEDNPKILSGSDSDPDQLQRANNTNPFLENLPNPIQNNTALNLNQTTTNQPLNSVANPFVECSSSDQPSSLPQSLADKGFSLPRTFRNRSFSETGAPDKDEPATISLKNLTNAFHNSNNTPNPGNPFSHVARKIKGPHMLQKTISEDYLFRKIGTSSYSQNGNGVGINGNNGANNTTWSFGRLLMQEDASFNLWRRNSSQTSLDSGSMASLDGVNLEHAISCDSVDSDLSTTGFNSDLDQSTYTQITGYLCVGLHYDK